MADVVRCNQRVRIERRYAHARRRRLNDLMPRLVHSRRRGRGRQVGMLEPSQRFARHHTGGHANIVCACVGERNHTACMTINAVADTRRAMADRGGRDPEPVKIGEPADARALASHSCIAQNHRLQSRLRREICGIVAAVRCSNCGLPARFERQHRHAIENQRTRHAFMVIVHARFCPAHTFRLCARCCCGCKSRLVVISRSVFKHAAFACASRFHMKDRP